MHKPEFVRRFFIAVAIVVTAPHCLSQSCTDKLTGHVQMFQDAKAMMAKSTAAVAMQQSIVDQYGTSNDGQIPQRFVSARQPLAQKTPEPAWSFVNGLWAN